MIVRLLKLLLLTLLSASTAWAQNFGVADWGASRQSILNQETRTNRTPLRVTDYLIYEASLPRIHRTRLVYQFKDGKLHQGRFLFEPSSNAPPETWIEQFEQVKSLIRQQYGAPDSEHQLAPGGGTPPPKAQWANALASDRLILKTQWTTETTEIIQQLAWRERSPHHQVIYRPLNQQAAEPSSGSF